MTKYEFFYNKANKAFATAKDFYNKKEWDLAKFYFDASECYKKLLLTLTVEEAEELCDLF